MLIRTLLPGVALFESLKSMARRNELLFFSRGKGRGHAVPDAAIARELVALSPGVEIHFISYSVGATTLRDLGWNVVDLGLPEDPPFGIRQNVL